MNFNEIIKVAWKSIASNKSRSILTMLGVIIGVAAVIVMMGVSAGTEATIAESIEGLGSNLMFVQSAVTRRGPGQSEGNDDGLVMDDVTAIQEQVNGIAGVSVDQSTSGALKYDNTSLEDIDIIGTTADFLTVRDLDMSDGRFLTEQDYDRTSKVVVLGSTVAEELFGEEDPIGQTITAESVKLTIVGVLEEKGLVSGINYDEQIYVPISLVFEKFMPSQFARMMGDSVRLIYVSVDEEYEMEDVMLQVELLLLNRHDLTSDEANFTITTQDDIIQTQESTTESFRMLLGWVAGVSLIVGGIGIMNIMLVSVTERTREIGLRQALGARPVDIQVQFLTEALMLSLVGGLLGVLFGVGGAWLFSELGEMRTVVVSSSIILSFTSAALVGIFFGYIPARKAAQLDPIVALRHD
jgi:putative ABC transport system permease protein